MSQFCRNTAATPISDVLMMVPAAATGADTCNGSDLDLPIQHVAIGWRRHFAFGEVEARVVQLSFDGRHVAFGPKLVQADARPLFAFPGICRRYKGPVTKDGPNVDMETLCVLDGDAELAGVEDQS